jgi:Fur family zinc uptake transcriptional regulator
MKNKILKTILAEINFTLTPLRQDILSILAAHDGPMGAYDILNKLRKKRPNAEPPTVYRVLDFLIETKLIHRVEAQNTYIFCSHISDNNTLHKAILLICKICHKTSELEDKSIFDAMTTFARKNKLEIDDALIEMKGVCKNCFSGKSQDKNC